MKIIMVVIITCISKERGVTIITMKLKIKDIMLISKQKGQSNDAFFLTVL